MRLYKLTNRDGTTRGGMQWGVGATHSLPKKKNPQLCGKDVIHFYQNKNLAFLLNPIHGGFDNPLLWTARGKIVVKDFGKAGGFSVTTLKKIRPPKWISSKYEQFVKIQFAILCASAVLAYYEKKYPGDKRPRKAIETAKKYLENPAAYAAAYAAADAAYAAAYAAYAADAAAYAAAYAAADAAYAAAYAADAAAYAAAHAAAHAAADAAYAAYAAKIDFGKLADKAVEMIYAKTSKIQGGRG